MPQDIHLTDLLPAHVLGLLDTGDSARVEEHLLSCVICRNEAGTLAAAMDQMAFAATPTAPPPDLKKRLMERVRAMPVKQPDERRRPRRRWTERLLPAWGLASLALIIALAGFSIALWQRLDRLEFLAAPGGMRAIPLAATEEAAGATGFVIIAADGRNGALVVDGLPPLGPEWQYQLWLIRDGKRTSGAVFSTDEESYGGTRIDVDGSLLEYSDAGITVEPAGGSPQPTGVKVLGGTLFSP